MYKLTFANLRLYALGMVQLCTDGFGLAIPF